MEGFDSYLMQPEVLLVRALLAVATGGYGQLDAHTASTQPAWFDRFLDSLQIQAREDHIALDGEVRQQAVVELTIALPALADGLSDAPDRHVGERRARGVAALVGRVAVLFARSPAWLGRLVPAASISAVLDSTFCRTLSRLRVALAFALLVGLSGIAHTQAHSGGSASLATSSAFSPSGELWIVGLDAQSHLIVQTSGDGGRNWSSARRIPTRGDTPAVSGEAPAKLAFGPQGRVVIVYTQPLAEPGAAAIRMLRSGDGGRSFSGPFTVHRDRQAVRRGFASVVFDAKGTLHTVWVDKRDARASAVPDKRPCRGAAIYRNESSDGGKTFGPHIRLARHVCECCRIALAAAPNGGLVALWRHHFASNERDHAFASVGKGALGGPVRATYDRSGGDTQHGPGLAAAESGGYHAVWSGHEAGVPGVRYGRLAADGSPRGRPLTLPDEHAEHADVQSVGPHMAIVWRSFDGEMTHWRAFVSHDDGHSFLLRELGQTADDNDLPRLARRGQEIFTLWRTTQGVQVQRLVP